MSEFVPKEEINLFSVAAYLNLLREKVIFIAAFIKAQGDPKDEQTRQVLSVLNECETKLESLAKYVRRF